MKKYVRMTLNERVQHLNLIINFAILVVTGFALKYSGAAWTSPITEVPAGMTFRGLLHRLSGAAIVSLGLYHILYMVLTPRGRSLLVDLVPRWKDALDVWETLKNNFYINRPPKEIKMGRFSFREKFEYLGLVWGTAVMTVTGFILWLEVEWLKYFPRWTFDVARAIHFYLAILATLTILVWHFYAVMLDPDVYPMSWAWITGNISEREMKLEHGLHLEQLEAEEQMRGSGSTKDLPTGQQGLFAGEVSEERTTVRQFTRRLREFNEWMRNWRGV
jgi:cytochrome b subunit of formate dehydrogenase